ncbi:Titin [Labeo rohita]|uniref:Titin n=1 Tax=Labeo rohita TaxID=84645 RepID=A0ABQ8L9Z3_LABRO|nr:Titin [Labeo rohita]
MFSSAHSSQVLDFNPRFSKQLLWNSPRVSFPQLLSLSSAPRSQSIHDIQLIWSFVLGVVIRCVWAVHTIPESPGTQKIPLSLPLLHPPVIPASSAVPLLLPVSPSAHPQSTICVVGSPRVGQSPSASIDPLSPPQASESWTLPWVIDPAAPPWLLAPSSSPWSVSPPALPGSHVPPAPSWSVIDHPPPRVSTPPATLCPSVPPSLQRLLLPSGSTLVLCCFGSGSLSLPLSPEPSVPPWPSRSSASPWLIASPSPPWATPPARPWSHQAFQHHDDSFHQLHRGSPSWLRPGSRLAPPAPSCSCVLPGSSLHLICLGSFCLHPGSSLSLDCSDSSGHLRGSPSVCYTLVPSSTINFVGRLPPGHPGHLQNLLQPACASLSPSLHCLLILPPLWREVISSEMRHCSSVILHLHRLKTERKKTMNQIYGAS